MQSRNHSQRGLGAAVMILMFAFGALALSLAANAAALTYADSVERRRERVQSELNIPACADSVALARAKDAFASGSIDIPELGCHVEL